VGWKPGALSIPFACSVSSAAIVDERACHSALLFGYFFAASADPWIASRSRLWKIFTGWLEEDGIEQYSRPVGDLLRCQLSGGILLIEHGELNGEVPDG
jgi:hypothetical protein